MIRAARSGAGPAGICPSPDHLTDLPAPIVLVTAPPLCSSGVSCLLPDCLQFRLRVVSIQNVHLTAGTSTTTETLRGTTSSARTERVRRGNRPRGSSSFELNHQLGCTLNADESETADRLCRCCRGIIASFPIDFVVDSMPAENIDDNPFCIPMLDQLEGFAKRRDGKEFLRTDDGKDLIAEMAGLVLEETGGKRFLPRYRRKRVAFGTPDPGIDAFTNKMIGLGAKVDSSGHVCVFYMPQRLICRWRESIADIFDCSIDNIPRHLFGSRVPRVLRHCHWSYRGDNKKKIVVRQTFDALVSCGFRLNPQDYILVDVNEEPALARLKEVIERDE